MLPLHTVTLAPFEASFDVVGACARLTELRGGRLEKAACGLRALARRQRTRHSDEPSASCANPQVA